MIWSHRGPSKCLPSGVLPELVCATLVPMLLLRRTWWGMFLRGVPRAWDGAGHYAAAQIYTSMFPDTFGYTAAYLHGMPFPNYYPPLLFFLVAAVNRLGVPFDIAFKVIAFSPQLVLPSLLYLLAWKISDKNRLIAAWAAIFTVLLELFPVLIDPTNTLPGIDYLSTFMMGMYSQLIGFVTLLAWFLVYDSREIQIWRFLLSTVLLACTCLASFFSALTAAVFVVCTLACDLMFESSKGRRGIASRLNRKLLLFHLSTPVLAITMVAFWVVPALATYEYFVTRPSTFAGMTILGRLFLLAGIIGAILSLRRRERASTAFLLSWLCLVVMLLLAERAPNWLPFQAHRFSATVTMLATVPVGFFVASCVRLLCVRVGLSRRLVANAAVKVIAMSAVMLAALAASFSSMVSLYDAVLLNYGFYPDERSSGTNPDFGSGDGRRDLTALLRFARKHPGGSYLIAFPYGNRIYDARAMNAYLGAQGEQSVLGVYREATPDAIFLYPEVGSLSVVSDNYGISATLAEDVDFLGQPMSTQVARLRSLGVRFFLTDDPRMKKRIEAEPGITESESIGPWSIFVLGAAPTAVAEALPYYPALFIGDFSTKLRTNTQPGFVRLAEEQFSDSWWTVRLIRSPELDLDSIGDDVAMARYGALIVQEYRYRSVQDAYDSLRRFAQTRPVILFPSDSGLFQHIRATISEFPHAYVLDRALPTASFAMNSDYGPTYSFGNSAIRQDWRRIREILDREKIPVWRDRGPPAITVRESARRMQLDSSTTSVTPFPVLVRRSYHPRWFGMKDEQLFAATPFFTVAYMRGSDTLRFERTLMDRIALAVSCAATIGMIAWCVCLAIMKRTHGRRIDGESEIESGGAKAGRHFEVPKG